MNLDYFRASDRKRDYKLKATHFVRYAVISLILLGCGEHTQDSVDSFKTSMAAAPTTDSSVAQLQGLRAHYEITANATGYLVKSLQTLTVTEYPKNIKSIKFDDLSVNLSIAANATSISSENLNALLELYIAYFNRAPDADGLNYWIDRLKDGMTLEQIGASFYAAAIIYADATGYSANMDNVAFVRVIYKNVLGRETPDQEGLDYWVNALNTKTETRGTLIKTMLASAHSLKTDTEYGWVHNLLVNKVKVGTYLAIENGISFNSASDSIRNGMSIAAAVTPDSVSKAMSLITAYLPVAAPSCTAPQVLQGGLCVDPSINPDSPGLDHQKTLIALINFPDNNSQTMSLAQVKDLIVSHPQSLNQFIKVNSNGKVSIDASFVDWTTLTKTSEYYFNKNQSNNNEFHNDAISALSKIRELTSVKRLILVVKDGFQGNPGCYAYQDKVTVGNAAEYNGYLLVLGGYGMSCLATGRIAHEYGHTYGFGHSLESRCEKSPPNSLVDLEYSNTCSIASAYSWTYDTMGSDSYRPLYSSVWRAKAGWFNGDQIKTVTSSGIYTLEQSELISNGAKLIRIPLGVNEKGDALHYYIEYRKKLGDFDPAHFTQLGKEYDIIVRTDDPKSNTHDLIDFGNGVLNMGKDFIDSYRDIKVSVVSIDGTGSSSSVSLNIQVPRITLKPSFSTFKSSTELEKILEFQNTSTNTLTISMTGIGGRNADTFTIKRDQCTGVALAPTQSCSLTVSRAKQESAVAYAYAKFNNGEAMRSVELQAYKISSSTPYDPNIPLAWQNMDADFGKKLTWWEAISYCENLVSDGVSDWRLPRIEELRNTFQLTSTPLFKINDVFWSISEVESNPANAYSIYGNDGNQWQNGSKNLTSNALCVRNK